MNKKLFIGTAILTAILLLAATIIYIIPLYILSPENIRSPQVNHYHARIQLVVNNQKINFSQPEFQEVGGTGVCNGDLTSTPIHFHDGEDQYLHLHWGNITGGQVLKYYGMNRIGGDNNILGYRQNTHFPWFPSPVNIHGNLLPQSSDLLWVYSRNRNTEIPTLRENNDFLQQDLETFFGIKSNLTQQREELKQQSSFLTLPTFAHGDDATTKLKNLATNSTAQPKTQEELKKINDLLGDVLIFVQSTKPDDAEVSEYFTNFIALKDSVCGG